MKRRRILIGIASILLIIVAMAFFVAKRRSIARYPATEHEKQIALACLRTLLGCATENELEPDDPRLPQILKDLHPVSIMIDPSSSFVLFPSGSNNPREYHLSRSPEDSKMWILYIVPAAPAAAKHLEALRISSEAAEQAEQVMPLNGP